MKRSFTVITLACFLAPLGLTACSSSTGANLSPGSGGEFQVIAVSVSNQEEVKINEEIEITFNADVSAASVNRTTFRILTSQGAPAVGTLRLKTGDPTTVIFAPRCPTLDDLSDAGFLPGGVTYTLTVVGRTTTFTDNVVKSAGGTALRTTQVRTFSTPLSSTPNIAFEDTRPGPPRPITREMGSGESRASYIELGGNDATRIYFALNPLPAVGESRFTLEVDDPMGLLPAGYDPAVNGVPLNLYSDEGSSLAVILEFDQPVNPLTSNINQARVHLEFLDGDGEFQPIDTRVTLVENCTETGATVRLEPRGPLPVGSLDPDNPGFLLPTLRTVVGSGFEDVAGQKNNQEVSDFGMAATALSTFMNLTPSDGNSDEFLEAFLAGGDEPNSNQDDGALFDTSQAEWGGGRLQAGFEFDGMGGPGGNFDMVIREDEILSFDTVSSTVSGGEGGLPEQEQNTVDGILSVRNLTIEEGGTLSVRGPNTFVLNASGTVRIEGLLDVSGLDSADVSTLGSGNTPAQGGRGIAGGGDGGDASSVLTNSTPRGDSGLGAFGLPGGGGQGGESGFAGGANKDARRPGGGGGGRFKEVGGPAIKANAGQDGHPDTAKGAETGTAPARGGAVGPLPFNDGIDENDFFGVRPAVDPVSGNPTLVRGELVRVHAGSGGGGGGDAIPSRVFPQRSWNPGSDEKGGGGGGGGGGMTIRALGPIIFGPLGEIRAEGGGGGTGENTNFNDHIGGSGGGGSGGHVVLETAAFIDFTDGGATTADLIFISTSGGKGAADSGPITSKAGTIRISAGGRGSAGLVQLHVPRPRQLPDVFGSDTDVFIPLDTTDPNEDNVARNSIPVGIVLVPSFGARSLAQSDWLSIGGADQDTAGGQRQVDFLFRGSDPLTGLITTDPIMAGGQAFEMVRELGPLIFGAVSDPDVAIDVATPSQIVFTGPTMGNVLTGTDDIYLRTPALLENFILRIESSLSPGIFRNFDVVDADYDDLAKTLSVTALDSNRAAGTVGQTLENYITQDLTIGVADYALIPRFFSVSTGGLPDVMPGGGFVRIDFQATGANALGAPDEANILTQDAGGFPEWKTDVGDLNSLGAGSVKFFRFRVEFNLGPALSGDTQPTEIDFLRIPFRF